jgi:tellurite resistance protein TerC
MIAAGATLIESLSVMSYLLGAILLILALRMLRGRAEPLDLTNSRALRLVRRLVPLTRDTASGRLVAPAGDGWAVTPLGLALVALIVVDATFAVDSVSAAFGITTDFLVIWLANALALLALVPLLALVRTLARRLRYMGQTFAALLAFIALRLLTQDAIAIGPLLSLAVILTILAAGVLASLIGDHLTPPPEPARAERRPPRCPPEYAADRARP